MKLNNIKTFVLLFAAFTSVTVFADAGTTNTVKNNQQTMAAIQTALTIAQVAIMADCVKPTSDLECNSMTATIVTSMSGIAGQLINGAVKGTAVDGTLISAGIGALGCQLIKCDTTASRNQKCDGFVTSEQFCPDLSHGSTTETGTCRSGTTCTTKQTTMNTDLDLANQADNTEATACGDVPVNAVTCTPATTADETARNNYAGAQSDCEQCITDCQSCETEDNGTVNPYKMCSSGVSMTDYNNCITTPYKTDAQNRQTKCRTRCDEMVALLAAFNLALTGITTELNKIEQQTTDSGNGNNNNNNTNNNNNGNGNNNNNYNPGGSGYPSLSSLGALTGLDQPKTSGTGTTDAGTSTSLGTGTGSPSGAGLGSKGGEGSGAGTGEEGSSSLGNFGGAGGGALGAKGSGASGKAGLQLRGLTKDSINKKELLPKDADLFKVVRDLHQKLYDNKAVGITTAVKKNVEKKTVSSKKNVRG